MIERDSRQTLALQGRTLDAFQKEDFQEVHFEIVNAVYMEGKTELENIGEETFKKIEQLFVSAIEQSSNLFRKFYGKGAKSVYASKDQSDRSLSEEYSQVLEETGPIAYGTIQEMIDKADLVADVPSLLRKLNLKDLMAYVSKKINSSGENAENEIDSLDEASLQSAVDVVVPVDERYDFDDAVIDSINYADHESLTDDEEKAIDIIFVLMNELWKVQQVYRATLEMRTNLDAEKMSMPEDKRIGEKDLEYRSYTDYLTTSFAKFSEESEVNGLVYAAYGVQKDLVIYLREVDREEEKN